MNGVLSAMMLDLRSVVTWILAQFDLKPAVARQVVVDVVAIWVLTWVGWQLVKLLSRRIVASADDHHGETVTFHEKRAQTVAQLIKSFGRGALLTLAVFLTLNQFFNITALLTWGAVLGLAVSFGTQSLVKDYFAGFFILLESQFVVGDVIEAAGKSGVVERLTLRTVRLRDIEGVVHIIPNGQITTLSNKTRGWSRAVVDIGVSYDNDIDRVITVLHEEADAFNIDTKWASQFDAPADVLGVESFGDNGVSIRVLLRTKPGVQAAVAREFRRRVLIRLEHEGIKGARAQQMVALAPHAAPATSPIPGAE